MRKVTNITQKNSVVRVKKPFISAVPFWEFGEVRGIPPLPPVYWNHQLTAKSEIKSYGSISCGKNLDFKELRHCGCWPPLTACALEIICFFSVCRKGRCHIGLWKLAKYLGLWSRALGFPFAGRTKASVPTRIVFRP